MNFTDTHCHLYAAEFDIDRSQMIERAIAAGVEHMFMPNIDLETIDLMMALVAEFPGYCFPMMGLHPCSVRDNYREVLDQIWDSSRNISFSGIGETGIDLYWDKTLLNFQTEAFEHQISWGLEMELPVIIHSRESLDINIAIIENHKGKNLKGIFHCFGGTYDQAIRIFESGFKIGIGGVITFKNSELSDLLPRLPREMIVLETDAPYLAPVPYRGKRNESAFLTLVAERVAFSLGIALEEVADFTTANAREVFGKKG